MTIQSQHIPIMIHNLRAAKGWRFRDMVNWHRLVKPLRGLETEASRLDLYPLMFDLCTRFSVSYQPAATPLATRIPASKPSQPGQPRVALFVDAPEHLSGVAVTIGNWVQQAEAKGLDLTILTAGQSAIPGAVEFQPMGTLELKNYAGMRLHVPQVGEVMDFMESAGFDMVHVSTPGPVGMLGVQAARSQGLLLSGTYHTDFPRYSVKLSGDPSVEDGSWNFMRWFYGQMDRVACPSQATLEDLASHGFDAAKLRVVGRGVKSHLFHPGKRDAPLRDSWGPQPHKLLYVGRISEEKNLDCLVYSFQQLCQTRNDTQLVVVGEGPYLETLRAKLQGFPVVFTGRQTGEALQRIYASCDLFVFPSETDTFGVVLMEAQSSGVPVVVSGKSGTRFAMREDITGKVVRPMTAEGLARTLDDLLADPKTLSSMRRAARAHAEENTQEKAFDTFWRFHLEQRTHPPAPLETVA